jgi:ferrochelatase
MTERGMPLPVVRRHAATGIRFLADTLAACRAQGFVVRSASSPPRSAVTSSCTQYRRERRRARASALKEAGLADVEIVYVADWHMHPGFIDANARHVCDALDQPRPRFARHARLVFTAHSIPVSMAERYPYQRQLERRRLLLQRGSRT